MEIVIDVNNTSYSFNSFFQINHADIRKSYCLQVLVKPNIYCMEELNDIADKFAVTLYIEMK